MIWAKNGSILMGHDQLIELEQHKTKSKPNTEFPKVPANTQYDGFTFHGFQLGISLRDFERLATEKGYEYARARDKFPMGESRVFAITQRLQIGQIDVLPIFRFVNHGGIFKLRAIDFDVAFGQRSKLLISNFAGKYGNPNSDQESGSIAWSVGNRHPTVIMMSPNGRNNMCSIFDANLTRFASGQ